MGTTTKRKRANGTRGQWIRTEKRRAIYARDEFSCAYCGDSAGEGCILTLDHVQAIELGGTNEASNLVTACFSCNSSKQHRTIREWFAALRDRGIDTSLVAARIRRQTARKLYK